LRFRSAPQRDKRGVAGIGQVKLLHSAVARTTRAGGEPRGLEPVDNGDDAALHRSEFLCKLTLAGANASGPSAPTAAAGSLFGSAPTLDLSRLPANPVELFHDWLDIALRAGVPEPLAMTLATVDADGMPDARTRIVKDVDEHGWAFAGPRSSSTSVQLAARPVGAINFWWQPVVEASRSDSEADLAARSAAARAGVEPGTWGLWRFQPERVEFW
jgi:pyridoxamine 5'-phosphate oxidase